ncbi:tRNA 2-selenouridine(34) synthase MnmH [Alphaproteobacteria bacterium]|nr:tRNA 2-selenouridine(34) synthase MnmH [Alphaproteobacteria bacterium]
MRINRVTFNKNIFLNYTKIVDVRSENEFADDHIPSSVNLPVLNNKERIIIGTQYKENSFEARKQGAALINNNISKIIKKDLFEKKDKVLIYCWRGGLRSLSLYLVLKQIGFDVEILEDGYKSYRRHVVQFFEDEIEQFNFNQIKGVTGVGKTLFLKNLEKSTQVLDLEGIANHKGSILGDIPKFKQPNQKMFETKLFEKLESLNRKKKIWVEAESIKIGKLNIPSRLWKKMDEGISVKLKATVNERVKFILKDYKYFTKEPELMSNAMLVLKKIIQKDDYRVIEENLENGDYMSFVKSLINHHYDKAYKRTRSEMDDQNDNVIEIDKINNKNFLNIIKNNKIFT